MQALILISLLLMQAPAARPTLNITGRIVFSDGAPVQSIAVRAVPVDGNGPAGTPPRTSLSFTDPAGAYRLAVEPGRYYVFLSDVPLYFPGVVPVTDAVPVTVTDSPVENVNIALPPNAAVHISGHVKFPAGQQGPSANQNVQMLGAGVRTVPIEKDGTFDIPHVRRGVYRITVTEAPGIQPATVPVTNADVRGIELNVPRLVPLSGTVTTENGSAPPRLTIAVEGMTFRTTATPGSDGAFHADVPEGRYHLGATLPKGYYLKSLESEKADLQEDLLDISEKDSRVAVKVTTGASAGVRVTGHVTVAGGGTSSTKVKTLILQARATTETAEVPIAADGSFELPRVLPGSYAALVTLESKLNSPFVPVIIPNRDLRGLVIEIPPEIEVRGRVEVDGYGLPPRFTLALIKGDIKLTESKAGELPSLPESALFEAVRGSKANTDAVQVRVNALPDGSFKMKLPEGSYRVAAGGGPNGVPAQYLLRSMTYGQADLFKEPMKVSSEASPELQIGFGTAAPNAWVSVKGKVRGYDPSSGPVRVALESGITSAVESPVATDGSFEFPRVLQRNNYTAHLVPADDAASSPRIAVADKDVDGIEIVVPAQKEVRIVASMEDSAPVPVFVLTLAGSGSTVTVVAKPARDGSFTARLPMDERRVSIYGFPFGYTVKSGTYRGTNVLKEPLKISKDDTDDLQVAFASDAKFPFGNLTGQISGLDPQVSNVRLELHGVTSFSTFESSVGADGSFSFSNIPQGAYMPILLGSGFDGSVTPSTVVVSGADPFSVQLTASNLPPFSLHPLNDDETNGVTVSSILGGRQAADESSAVAQLRTINTAEVTHLSSHAGNYGTIDQMIQAGLLDQRFGAPVSGFNYSVIAVGSVYAAAAIPESPSTGRYGYYALPDAIIRYVPVEAISPPGQGGKPVQ